MKDLVVDVGANQTHASFRADLGEVIARAVEAGVTRMIVTGASVESSRAGATLAAAHPGTLFATAGVHPHEARRCDETTIPSLRELLARPDVLAIGECGLDYNRDYSPRPLQDRWFLAQLELAAELGRPVFLHERDAHARFVEILAPILPRLPGAVVHCFTGTDAELDAYLALGLHIGITGWICDERRGLHLRELVQRIPLDRLMLETDAPYLTPRDLRPKPRAGRNEPAFLAHVLSAVAGCLGRPAAEVAAATSATARRFFRLP